MIVLNPDQEAAVTFFKRWWNSDRRFAILEGAAGTGKTTIVRHLVKDLAGCDPLFTALTNEACKQLENTLPAKSLIKTTHSALGFHFNASSEVKSLDRRGGVPAVLNDINLLIIDECFHPSVEVLTDRGFRFIKDLDKTERVASMNLETKLVTFNKPIRYIENDYDGTLLNLETDKVVSFSTTENHDHVSEIKGNLVKSKLGKFKSFSKFYLTATSGEVETEKFSDWYRLALAFQADGYYNVWKGTTHTNKYEGYSTDTTSIGFSFTRPRKIDYMTLLLNRLDIQHSIKFEEKTGKTLFRVNHILASRVSKKLDEVFTLPMSKQFACEFIQELMEWDGHRGKLSQLYYSSTVESNVDFAQAVAVLAGYKTNKTVQVDSRKDTYKDVHRLFLTDNQTSSNYSNFKPKVTTPYYKGKVYCLETVDGTVVIRHNGLVSISGNCSMVGTKLLEAIEETGKKTLFIGHRSQLPEVVKNLSSFDDCESVVFKQEYPIYTLTTPERNKGELFQFLLSLEKLIYEQPRVVKPTYNKTLDYLIDYIDSKEGKKELLNEESKVICWSNAEVDKFNNYIRKSVFNAKELPAFVLRDRIIFTEPVQFVEPLTGLSKSKIANFTGSDKVITFSANTKAVVRKVSQTTVLHIPCWELEVDCGNGLRPLIYVAIDQKQLAMLDSGLRQECYAFSGKQAREKAFRRYHFIMGLFAKVKHSYAITTHRSQGMTIPNVFVSWSDIRKCQNVYMKHKLLYVAASRARDSLTIIT